MEILLPKMGESVAEATIIRWVVEEGQSVAADEPIIEIATDKVDSEVPAPEDGVLVKHLVAEGDVVQVGQPIAEFSMNGEAATAQRRTSLLKENRRSPVQAGRSCSRGSGVGRSVRAVVLDTGSGVFVFRHGSLPSAKWGRFYSPLVRSIASKEGIGQAELDAIPGSGKEAAV